jgi:VanZ family protein
MIRKNKFTIVTAMVILYLSLAGSITFGQSGILNIPYIDKIGHFGLYFTLMSVIILEHKNLFQNTRQLLLVALIPFFFGNLIEILQMTLTTNRKGEILDALANSAGITIALFLWLFIKPYYKQEFRK